MDVPMLPVIGGPADGQAFPFDAAPLWVFTEGYAVAHAYRMATGDDGRVWLYVGPEPLDAIATPVAGWRV